MVEDRANHDTLFTYARPREEKKLYTTGYRTARKTPSLKRGIDGPTLRGVMGWDTV
jgi:hypothetical protein